MQETDSWIGLKPAGLAWLIPAAFLAMFAVAMVTGLLFM
jgi:hypothetical protein